MVGMSCAGDALYVVIAGPVAATDDEYKRNWGGDSCRVAGDRQGEQRAAEQEFQSAAVPRV